MDSLDLFHPAVRTWFERRFPLGPTEPQERDPQPAVRRAQRTEPIVTERPPAVGDLDLGRGHGLELGPDGGQHVAEGRCIFVRGLGGPRPEPEPPHVTVTIGRIEVVHPAAPPPPAPAPAPGPRTLSLDEYLEHRGGRSP